MVRLQSEPVRVEELIAEVASAAAGAVALFLGTVRRTNRGRDVSFLEYQAYAGMAEAEMGRIEQEATERFGLSGMALVHRTGRLEIGEVSVGVAAAAPHRGPALEACRWAIDTLKRTVPIWKKEHFDGGEVWIEGADGRAPASRRPSGPR